MLRLWPVAATDTHWCAAELSMPKNLALARHGRVSDARELFLLSDAAQARMRTIIGMEHIRSVVRDVQFLRHDEAPPAHGNMYCKFMQHAWDWKYTDLLPPKVCTLTFPL